MEGRLFEVDESVEFDYVENQRLNSSLCIRNLTDQVISFNVKTNVPKLYPVVKPPGGIIYGGDQHKITISRLPLSKEEYEVIRDNPNIALKDIFQVSCTLEYTDGLGKVQSREQSKNVPVRVRRRSSFIATPVPLTIVPQKEKPQEQPLRLPPTRNPTSPLTDELARLTAQNSNLLKHNQSLQYRIDIMRDQKLLPPTIFDRGEVILLSVACALLSLCFVV